MIINSSINGSGGNTIRTNIELMNLKNLTNLYYANAIDSPSGAGTSGGTSFVLNNLIYYAKGSGTGLDSKLYVYNDSTNSWSTSTTLPFYNAYVSSCVVNNVAYFIAYSAQTTQAIWSYNGSAFTKLYTFAANTFAQNRYLSIENINGTFYICGASYLNNESSTPLYTFNGTTVTKKASLDTTSQQNVFTCVFNNELYAILGGGLYKYNITGNSWTKVVAATYGYFPIFVYKNYIYGLYAGANECYFVYYNSSNNTWNINTTMTPPGRYFTFTYSNYAVNELSPAIVVRDGKLYLIGGVMYEYISSTFYRNYTSKMFLVDSEVSI